MDTDLISTEEMYDAIDAALRDLDVTDVADTVGVLRDCLRGSGPGFTTLAEACGHARDATAHLLDMLEWHLPRLTECDARSQADWEAEAEAAS